MKMQINFYYLLSITSFLFGVTQGYEFPKKSSFINRFKSPLPNSHPVPHPMSHPIPQGLQVPIPQPPKDQFYLVIVENLKTNVTENSKVKRQLNDVYIDNIVDEINSLIVGNKNTYINPGKLDELDNEAEKLRKRDGQDPFAFDYGSSNYVYKISSTENKTVLYAYLSDALSKTVDTMQQVVSCQPDRKIKYELDYNKNEVLNEAGWKGVATVANANTHLSLISQGEFDEEKIHQFDNTYYYPSSGGKDIDIVVLDTEFNFDFFEFDNTERRAECLYYVKDAKARNSSNKKYCFGESDKHHGSKVADAAAGKQAGVAPKANVYGVLFDHNEEEDGYMTHSNVITALETIKSRLIRPYKTVINISQGFKFSNNSSKGEIEESNYILDLLAEISKKAVIVVSAGNKNEHLTYTDSSHKMYCYSKNVICVGGIENYSGDMASIKNDAYRKAGNSNYGECVDIYAPYSARVYYHDQNFKSFITNINGTSISAPIVSGVAATIMSDQPNTNFNTQSMLKYLRNISLKNIISGLSSDSNNYFINNGKHIVYSKDNVYYGCGVESGNVKCGRGQCCSKYGYCGTSSKHCGSGCQRSFGTCS